MPTVTVQHGYNGQAYRLDTPDVEMIAPWLVRILAHMGPATYSAPTVDVRPWPQADKTPDWPAGNCAYQPTVDGRELVRDLAAALGLRVAGIVPEPAS